MNTFADAGLVNSRTNTKASVHAFLTRPEYIVYSPVAVEKFSGLNLTDDPGTVGWEGAIDLLNVDFDQRGRLRSRDGYAKLTAAAAATRYGALEPFYTTTGIRQLVAARDAALVAVDTVGAVVATQVVAASNLSTSIARFAAPGSEHAYVASSGGGAATVYRWDGTAWSTPAWTTTTPTGRHLAVSAEGRLVNARYNGTTAGDNASTVRFCDISGTPPTVVPTTWPANNYVDVSPGDGEEITALATWSNLLFAFKGSRFAVFYGTSTDSNGNPVFNYRMVEGQGLPGVPIPANPTRMIACYRAITPSPHGLYFTNSRGIWLTTGGPPELISGAVDPIFRGQGASSFWQGTALYQDNIYLADLHWHDNRLYFAYPSTSTIANDRMLVHDPAAGTWTAWDMPAGGLASFRIGVGTEELVFSQSAGTNDICRHSSAYTSDAGTAITSRYRSGFSDLGTTQRKRVREWILEGSGSPTLKTSVDFGSLETGAAVTLGTAPAIAEQRRRYAPRGRQFSWQVGATTAWSLNNFVAHVDEKRAPGTHS